MNSGTASGRLSPQSHAAATQIRSGPRVSSTSTARRGGDLRDRVQRQPGPEPVVEDHVDGVLLGVVDHHAVRLDPLVGGQRLHDHLGALPLVLEVGRVDVDELLVLHREVDVVLEAGELVLVTRLRPISPMPSTFGISR